nr:hypothetical protein [Odoribacter sp. OF09-27XD]
MSNGYGGFMEGLLQLVEGKEIEEILGEKAHGDEIECYYIYKNYLDLQEANCKFHSPYRKILY